MLTLVVLLFVVVLLLLIFFLFKRTSSSSQPRTVKHTYGDEGYEILEIYNFLTPKECQEIIDTAKNQGMFESSVSNYGTRVDKDTRKSKTAILLDEKCMKVAKYCEKITGIPRENQEELQVTQYEPGGKFIDHFDAYSETDEEYKNKMNRNAGQRKSTFIVYLNDNFEGGETEFVNLGLKIKPETGKAILFWNVDDQEKILEKSKHRGNEVKNGEKWICTKWSHVKKWSTTTS